MRRAGILWWLVTVGCGEASDEVGEAVAPHPLEANAYRFCHTPGADAEAAAPWCDFVDEIPEERCPGLRATCEGATPVPPSGCNEGGSSGQGTPDAPAAPPEPPADDLFAGWNLEGADALLRWVMALLVAFLVLLLARLLWTYFGRREASDDEVVPVTVAIDDPSEDDGLDDVPQAPSSDLLTMAAAALADGRDGEAAVLARGAALRHLGQQGMLRLHRSRTDREYVRSVDDREVRADLRAVVATAEAYRFGQQRPARGAAEAALAAATRLIRGAALLLALVLTGATPAEAQTPERYGPYGDAALLELYRQWGHEASWRLRGLDTLGPDLDVLVVDTSMVALDDDVWDALRAWVEAGGVLVVAGEGADGFPELGNVTAGQGPLETVGPGRRANLPAPAVPAPVSVYQGGVAIPWVLDAEGSAVVSSSVVGGGVVVGLADVDLLTNAALAIPRNERFLGDLLLAGQSVRGWPVATPLRVQLATTGAIQSTGDSSNGASANNPLASLSHAELLPFVLHLLVLWTLIGLWRGWPFGPRRDPPDDGRLRFADHIEALGERYRRLGATRHVLAAYAGLWLARLGPAGLQLAAQRAGMSTDDAVRWVRELEAVVERPDGPDHDNDVQRMEELWRVVEQA